MPPLLRQIFILSGALGIAIGIFLIARPALAIELQRRFYVKINWRIEPVSMTKEIRNTRLMGWFLAAVLIATFLFMR